MSKYDEGFLAGVKFAAELARRVADKTPVETSDQTWSRCGHGAISAMRGLADALDEFCKPDDGAPAPPAPRVPVGPIRSEARVIDGNLTTVQMRA